MVNDIDFKGPPGTFAHRNLEMPLHVYVRERLTERWTDAETET